jgi:hypothetical protein
MENGSLEDRLDRVFVNIPTELNIADNGKMDIQRVSGEKNFQMGRSTRDTGKRENIMAKELKFSQEVLYSKDYGKMEYLKKAYANTAMGNNMMENG